MTTGRAFPFACILAVVVSYATSPAAADDAEQAPKRIGAIVLEKAGHSLYCGVIDEVHGYAWFGTDMWPGQVIKVKLPGH